MRGIRMSLMLAVFLLAWHATGAAQLPLGPVAKVGQTVYPVYEGWYYNPDGSISLSFGYFNRNFEEVIEVPTGPDNLVTPGPPNQGQPTHFQPRRHWGVFAIRVPGNYQGEQVVWTLTVRGETHAIPANLGRNYQIDALEGEAGSGNTPPRLRFAANGPDGAGPRGVTGAPLRVKVDQPLTLIVWATDDGRSSGNVATSGRSNVPVTLTWFKHQGPGTVTFSDVSPKVGATDHKATTAATFAVPGEYVLRVRANDASGVSGAGHAQCCWTNGFVKVTVSP